LTYFALLLVKRVIVAIFTCDCWLLNITKSHGLKLGGCVHLASLVSENYYFLLLICILLGVSNSFFYVGYPVPHLAPMTSSRHFLIKPRKRPLSDLKLMSPAAKRRFSNETSGLENKSTSERGVHGGGEISQDENSMGGTEKHEDEVSQSGVDPHGNISEGVVDQKLVGAHSTASGDEGNKSREVDSVITISDDETTSRGERDAHLDESGGDNKKRVSFMSL